ncbi:hypothetical protein SCOCK_100192 [Actinacidiphila cocklensis]|uniref:Uncharacterized protein n=1 Tax=Actinacidiphila cocklensis TaxID=887465 RepID=A0A9W4DGW2_9ACTN|nr:hypothetical protein SCOCK_100192 [Actinacidiphila cocklensis]
MPEPPSSCFSSNTTVPAEQGLQNVTRVFVRDERCERAATALAVTDSTGVDPAPPDGDTDLAYPSHFLTFRERETCGGGTSMRTRWPRDPRGDQLCTQ